MLLFWITVPLMLVAVLAAAVPLILLSVSEDRRIRGDAGPFAPARPETPPLPDDEDRLAA
jgi:hypothetical protein